MTNQQEQATARARTKYRDLSTALRTMMLSGASVEMTWFSAGLKRACNEGI
jgi:hypothetical protein